MKVASSVAEQSDFASDVLHGGIQELVSLRLFLF